MHILKILMLWVAGSAAIIQVSQAQQKPNIVFIYTDDLGYSDLSCYGATAVQTPNIDRLAQEGLLFTHAHSTSATCTPSRFSLLTGKYAWRKKGTGIAPGNASLLIDHNAVTLPRVMQQSGFTTAIIGKWHLGLGDKDGPDWNGELKPGPLELGFDQSFIIPATVDRVPCVFVEGHKVVNYDPQDPIQVSYKVKIGNEPTGRENPELLKLVPSHGHDQTIVNGISRIGYMTGGKKALWRDQDIADVLTAKALQFLDDNASRPFFLFFSTHDIHVPRPPHERFAGKSGMGPRGDVILQLDWCVGEILKKMDELNLTQNTMIIFSSDNGPVVDDGYRDLAVEKLGDHKPAGPYRGGKYSAYEGGTRVPMIVRWPGKVRKGVNDQPFSQIDFLASFSAMAGYTLKPDEAPDSFDAWKVMTGKSKKGRPYLVEHAMNGTLSLIQGDWKYIEPHQGPRVNRDVNIELGNDPLPQLYNLKSDPSEQKNLASQYPKKVKTMEILLTELEKGSPTRK